jgi:hypothetical protein
MATYKGPQSAGAKHGSSESGNAFAADNKVTPDAALALADIVVLAEVPAGTRLHGLKYRNGDFDTGTALVVDVGYRSTHAEAQLTADPDYFLDGSTALQAAQAGWVDIPFEPITFNEPVQIILTVMTAAAGVSGTPSIYAVAEGQVVGVA